MIMFFFLDAVTLHQLFHRGLVPLLFFCGSRRGIFTSSVALSGDITKRVLVPGSVVLDWVRNFTIYFCHLLNDNDYRVDAYFATSLGHGGQLISIVPFVVVLVLITGGVDYKTHTVLFRSKKNIKLKHITRE